MRNNNNSGGLITLLTVLLATCVIAEAGIASHVGVTMQINQQANEEANARYEEYQEQQRQAQEEPAAIDYIGPNVHVKDGQVVRGALSRTATTRSVVAEPEPEQQTEPTPTPEPAEEPEVQPAVPSEKPKASAEAPKASDNGEKVASTPKPSGGTGNAAVASKPTDTPKAPKSTASNGNANNFNAHNNPDQQNTTDQWVLNTSTKKIHYPKCRDVPKIAEKNYATSNSSESDLIAQGYSTCGHCH